LEVNSRWHWRQQQQQQQQLLSSAFATVATEYSVGGDVRPATNAGITAAPAAAAAVFNDSAKHRCDIAMPLESCRNMSVGPHGHQRRCCQEIFQATWFLPTEPPPDIYWVCQTMMVYSRNRVKPDATALQMRHPHSSGMALSVDCIDCRATRLPHSPPWVLDMNSVLSIWTEMQEATVCVIWKEHVPGQPTAVYAGMSSP
jgi:hypothetical protein